MTTTLTTDRLITSTHWTDLLPDAKVETLDESFRRLKTDHPTMTLNAWGHHSAAFTARRLLESGTWNTDGRPYESLNIGQVFAAWTDARLDEIEQEWGDRIDILLADFEAKRIEHHEFCAEATRADRRRGLRRTATTKAAYGVTYKQFVNTPDERPVG